MNSVVIKSIDRERVERAVKAHVDLLRQKHPEIVRAIWFGSWVNGFPTPGSDVDLCLILTSSERLSRDRIPDYLPVGFPVGIDLLVYTLNEFEQLRDTSPGLYRAIVSGVDL